MKKFSLGLIVGLIIGVLSVGMATAATNIKLIINGREIKMDVQPQMVDGRVLVPARFIAEPLGATVEWRDNSVMITSEGGKEKMSATLTNSEYTHVRVTSSATAVRNGSDVWTSEQTGYVYKNDIFPILEMPNDDIRIKIKLNDDQEAWILSDRVELIKLPSMPE